MPAPAWEDLTEFFDTDDDGGFAVVASLTLADGTKRDINVIYDEPFSRMKMDGGGEIDGDDYAFTAPDSAVLGLENKCAVLVAGKTLYVLAIEQDGTGVSRVYLAPYTKSVFDRPGSRL